MLIYALEKSEEEKYFHSVKFGCENGGIFEKVARTTVKTLTLEISFEIKSHWSLMIPSLLLILNGCD